MCIRDRYSLGFTGDINAVMNAHNLAMVALTSRMQHERNYNDEKLLRLSGMPRLNIDPTNVNMGWVIDYCCQSLRNIIIEMCIRDRAETRASVPDSSGRRRIRYSRDRPPSYTMWPLPRGRP